MYIMYYHTGRKCWIGKFNSDVDKSNFRIGILDTDDMFMEDVDRLTLERLFHSSPSLNIVGINHNKDGKIVSIYDSTNNNQWYVDDLMQYAVHYEEFCDRGSYIQFELYKKGVGKILEKTSGHVSGRWSFDIGSMEVCNTSGGDMIMLDVRLHDKRSSYDLNDIVISINSYDDVELRHFPEEYELKSFR